MDWLPINSAPRGEFVLVHDADWGVMRATKEGSDYWWCGFDEYGNDRTLLRPTHWMPLPPPPENTP